MSRRTLAGALLATLLLAACDEPAEVAAPAPQELTREAIGHYCNMIVVDHKGPKGQIFLAGQEEPIWFTSVRDTVAFTMLPDEPKNIAAIYVTDVGRASWDSPEPESWTDARAAWYVIGSDRRGGMGAPEAVPFSEKGAADDFAKQHGGHVVTFGDIPEAAILTTEASDGSTGHDGHNGSLHGGMMQEGMAHGDAAHEDHDMTMPQDSEAEHGHEGHKQ